MATIANRSRLDQWQSADQWKPQNDSGLREVGKAIFQAVLIALPIVGIGGGLMYRGYAEAEAARLARIELHASHERLVAAAAGPMLETAPLIHGRDLFEATCAACHGLNGQGMPGLGKDMTKSWFIASTGDAELQAFVVAGRAVNDPLNTTKVPMPPKGGHPELSDADIADVLVYVRGLQDPRRMPQLPPSALAAAAAAPPSADEKAAALAAAGGNAELAEYIAHGTKVFAQTCAACHGKDGHGLPKLGKDLVASDFAKKLDDDALLAFLKRGRDPSDPLNTTKVGMPPKGGNPALSDDDLLDVISYVRSLQKQSSAQ